MELPSTSTSTIATTSLVLSTANSSTIPYSVPVSNSKKSKHKSEVLDEDVYLEKLEKIIQRDFYPDISKLKAQNEYLDAVKNNDQVKLKQLQEKFSSRRTDKPLNTPRSPAFFETPLVDKNKERDWEEASQCNEEDKSQFNNLNATANENKRDDNQDEKLTVDKFLWKYTSEDNDSFDELLDRNEAQIREKFAWMHKAEVEHGKKFDESLALRHADEQALLAIEDSRREGGFGEGAKRSKRASVDNWNYKAFNAVMFTPTSVAFSPEEIVDRHKMQQREIVHDNTRLPSHLYSSPLTSQTLSRGGTLRAAGNLGKVDSQGNEVNPRNAFGKYSLVVTPSPAPGVGESPLMTWGEIEGTPFMLDASDTVVPSTPGPSFKIPDLPVRDELALKMTADLARKNKEKKKAAIQGLQKLTPKFNSVRSVERLDSMSPAAKRLATAKLGIRLGTDKSLKASYTPSPSRKSTKTPLVDYETPKMGSTRASAAKSDADPASVSLTDNLLNISSRKPTASDFF